MITVIIPLYNAQNTIIDAIQSVRSQDGYESMIDEVIIVNDGSTDSSASDVNSFIDTVHDKKLRLITTANSGPASARNCGIRQARSDWVAFLDADDIWLPAKITRQAAIVHRFPGCQLVACSSDRVAGPYGREVAKNLFKIPLWTYMFRSRMTTSGVLMQRHAAEKAGLFPEGASHAEDEHLFMRIVADGGAYYINEPLVKLCDKPLYGGSGLSADLLAMHRGRQYNILTAKRSGLLGICQYITLSLFEDIKYTRRRLRTWMKK